MCRLNVNGFQDVEHLKIFTDFGGNFIDATFAIVTSLIVGFA